MPGTQLRPFNGPARFERHRLQSEGDRSDQPAPTDQAGHGRCPGAPESGSHCRTRLSASGRRPGMNRSSDVVVIGGGVIGCAVAYSAAKRGQRVTLVDQPKRGRATSASAGGLWPLGESLGLGCGVIFYKALLASGAVKAANGPEQLPKTFLDFAIQSNEMFPALAEDLVETAGMDIELERTSLFFLMYDEGDESFARSIWQNCPRGQSRIDWLTPEEVARAEPALTREIRGALRFNGDDQVNPYRTADALRAGARHHGARLLLHTEVTGIEVEGGRVAAVQTRSERVPADFVVNAAGAWAGQVARMVGVDVPVRPVRGQIVCTDMLPPLFTACLSTTDCYLAQKHHGEVIIGSTTEEVGFDSGVTPTAIQTLCEGAVRAVPALADVGVKRVWSGLRPGSPDELPILGPVDGLEGYLNACGHFRTGILTAPLTGLMLAEIMAGEKTSFAIEPFLLSRFPPECRESRPVLSGTVSNT
ncbi:MAG: NAD(P)/FAD-dependent oxidoreductase [Thermoanaerobaculia bacterium]